MAVGKSLQAPSMEKPHMKQRIRIRINTLALTPICLAVAALVTESVQAQTTTTAAQRIEVTGNSLPRLDERATSTSRLYLSEGLVFMCAQHGRTLGGESPPVSCCL